MSLTEMKDGLSAPVCVEESASILKEEKEISPSDGNSDLPFSSDPKQSNSEANYKVLKPERAVVGNVSRRDGIGSVGVFSANDNADIPSNEGATVVIEENMKSDLDPNDANDDLAETGSSCYDATMSRSSNGRQPERTGSRIGEDPEINSSSEDIPKVNNVSHQPSEIQHIIGPTDDTRLESRVQDTESSSQVTDSLRKLRVISMWGFDIDFNVTPMTSELTTLSPSLTDEESSVGFSPKKSDNINSDLDLNEAPHELKMNGGISGLENTGHSPSPMMSLDLNDTPSDSSTRSDQNPVLYESQSHKTSSYLDQTPPWISDQGFFEEYLGTSEEYDFLPFSSGSSARKRKEPDTGWEVEIDWEC